MIPEDNAVAHGIHEIHGQLNSFCENRMNMRLNILSVKIKSFNDIQSLTGAYLHMHTSETD